MNFFKRATTSILRRPSKTIILLLLIFILGTVISGALAVEGAVSNTDANLRRGMRQIVTFQQDYDAYQEHMEELGLSWDDPDVPRIEPLTPEMVRTIGALPQVEHFEYSIPLHMMIEGFREFNLFSENYDEVDESHDQGMAWLQLRGSSETELLQVRENIIEIVEGRSFEEAELETASEVNPMIISAGFARVNDLSLGDIIELPQRIVYPQPENQIWDPEWELNHENIYVEEKFEFEIVGIFDSVEDINFEDNSEEAVAMRNRLNNILSMIHVPNSVAEAMQQFNLEQHLLMFEHMVETGMEIDEWTLQSIEELQSSENIEDEVMNITSIMVLNDPLDMEAFSQAAEDILPDFWAVEGTSGGFDAISSSMETMQNIAFWVLVVSVGATLLILSLLITLFLRDRRYEMGVYLALGEKKTKIIYQILIEVVATAFIGITLAVFTGNLISGVMSQTMLRNELTAENSSNNQMDMGMCIGCDPLEDMGFTQEMSPEEMLEAFDVSINIATVGLFYAVGLGAVIFSTIVPVIYVVTLNPKKVLM